MLNRFVSSRNASLTTASTEQQDEQAERLPVAGVGERNRSDHRSAEQQALPNDKCALRSRHRPRNRQ